MPYATYSEKAAEEENGNFDLAETATLHGGIYTQPLPKHVVSIYICIYLSLWLGLGWLI